MIRIALSVLLSVSLAGPAFAQGVSTSSAAPPPAAGGGGGSLPAALSPMGGGGASAAAMNLNLGSTVQTISGSAATQVPTVINVGGLPTAILPTSQLTPAEYLAALQVRSGLPQTMQVGRNGAAQGGSAVLGDGFLSNLASLVVPKNVALTTVTSTGNVNIAGDLVDHGSMYVTAANAALSAINLNAANVIVTGLLSAPQNIAFNLNATGSVKNSGTIFSGGDLNIASGAGQIVNSGLVSSDTGSIRLSSSAVDGLNVDARGGSFHAVNGNIDVVANNIDLTGGNYLSKALNLNAAAGGTIDGALGQVTGTLNTSGLAAHLSASTANLVLGAQYLTGDPTYVNKTGGITISGGINTFGEDLAIIASGDIVAQPFSFIDTDGGDVLLIAGAGVTTSSAQFPTQANANVTVDLNTGSGGNVDFSALGGAAILNASNNVGRGGDVTIVAHANGATGGKVLFPFASTIRTEGNNGAGDLQIFAGASSGNGLAIGNVAAFGNSGSNGGTVALIATQAVTSDGQPLQVTPSGSILPINHLVPSTINALDVSFNSLGANASGVSPNLQAGRGGDITVVTNGGVTSGSLSAFGTGGAGAGGAGGTITIAAGDSVAVTSISVNGALSQGSTVAGANGGTVSITSTNGSVSVTGIFGPGGTGSTGLGIPGGAGGNGGTVSIYGKTGITIGLVDLYGGQGGNATFSTTGNGGAGGALLLNSNGSINITNTIRADGGSVPGSSQPGAGGHGGSIGIYASTGVTQLNTKSISATGGLQPNAGNYSFGDGGDVIISSSAGAISVGSIDVSATGATTAGHVFSMGSGGEVIILGTDTVSVGIPSSVTTPAIDTSGANAGGSGGGIAISAQSLTLNGVDGSNNVVVTNGFANGGSVMFSLGGTGNVLNLDASNPNIKTNGGFSTGNVWALSQTGTTHSAYTVNSGGNINDFTNLTVSTLMGAGVNLDFVSGQAPLGLSPGGWNDVNVTVIAVNPDNDPTLIVPIASRTGGAVVVNQLVTGYNGDPRIALFSPGYINIASVTHQGAGVVPIVAAIANEGDISITPLFNGTTVDFGSAIAGGQLILTAGDTPIVARNELKGQSIEIDGLGIDFQGTTATRMRTTGGDINFLGFIGDPLTINNSALFATALTGDVSFAPAFSQAVQFTGTNNFVTTAPNFNINTPQVLLNNMTIRSVSGGNITFGADFTGNLSVEQHGAFYTLPAGTTTFAANSLLNLGGATNAAIELDGTGKLVFSAPQIQFNTNGTATSVTANNVSTIEFDANQIVVQELTSANVSTNQGAIIVRPSAALTISSSSGGAATLNLDANSSSPNSFVYIQALGNVTLGSNMTLASNSPIQVNLNAAKTVTLDSNSVLKTTFSGNIAFPDPLGGTFQYSILIQNLVTDLNIAGTGTILQGGATPGYTVFHDNVDVGIADGADIKFVSTNPGSLVNFFTRQVQIDGANPLVAATLRGTNVGTFNFNTNLPSFSPAGGDFAFTGANGTSLAELNVLGAPVSVGFVGTPPVGIPAAQERLTVLNVGLNKAFGLFSDNNIILSSADVNFYPGTLISTGATKGITLQSGQDLVLHGTVGLQAGTTLIEAPNVVLSQVLITASQSVLELGPGAAATDMTVAVTTGGSLVGQAGIRFAPTAGLEFKATTPTGSIGLQSPAGIIRIDGVGDLTIADNTTLLLNAPAAINLASGTTLELKNQAVLQVVNGGGSAASPPLLVASTGAFSIGGSGGQISLNGAPTYVSFVSPTSIGFEHGTSLTFADQTSGSVVNFFSPQYVVNGDGVASAATAVVSASGPLQSFNFNIPATALTPSNLAFDIGSQAAEASLTVNGAPVNIGFAGSTPAYLPAGQKPINVLAVGLLGPFALNAPSITANANGIQVWNGAALSATSGDLTLATSPASNQPILLNGALSATNAVKVAVHGTGNILNLDGAIEASTVNLSSEFGSIATSSARLSVSTTDLAVNTTGGSAFIKVDVPNAVNLMNSNLGSGTLVLTALGGLNVTGTVSGNFLFLTSNSFNDALTVEPGASVNGNSVSLTAKTVVNNGTVIGAGELSIGNDFSDTLDVQGTGGWTAPQLFGLSSEGGINAGATLTPLLQGGTNILQIRAEGVTTLPVNAISVTQDAQGNGGSIDVRTVSLAVPNATVPTTFTADSDGTTANASGGTIHLEFKGTTAQTIGAAAGNLQLSAKAAQADGNGGTIRVENGGNLTVNPTAIVATPGTSNGNGGSYILEAGAQSGIGVLLVKGALSANGIGTGSGGYVELRSDSSTSFMVNSKAAKNGVQGLVSVNGGASGSPGTMQFVNNGGGVSLMQNVQASSLSLIAGGTGSVTSGAANVITASGILAQSANGSVTLPNISTGGLFASTSVNAAAGVKGAITLTNTGTGTVEVSANAGGKVTVNAAKGSVVLQSIGDTLAPSSLAVTALKDIDNTGSVNVNGTITEKTTATTGASRITAGSSITATGAITFTTAGAPGAGSGIDVSQATVSSSKSVTYSATKGDILMAGTIAPKVTATAFNKIETTEVIIGTNGVTLKTTSTKGPDSGSIKVSSIQTGTPNVAGSVGGAIAVTAAGGTLTVTPGAQIKAFSDKTTKASILLQNNEITGTAPLGNILIDSDAKIETSGALASSVTITMGAAVQKNTTLPSQVGTGLTFNPSTQPTPPVFFFGTNSVTFNSSLATPIEVNSTGGQKVIFNTGKLPSSAIQINGGILNTTTITAKAVGDVERAVDDFVVDTDEDDCDAALTLLP